MYYYNTYAEVITPIDPRNMAGRLLWASIAHGINCPAHSAHSSWRVAFVDPVKLWDLVLRLTAWGKVMDCDMVTWIEGGGEFDKYEGPIMLDDNLVRSDHKRAVTKHLLCLALCILEIFKVRRYPNAKNTHEILQKMVRLTLPGFTEVDIPKDPIKTFNEVLTELEALPVSMSPHARRYP